MVRFVARVHLGESNEEIQYRGELGYVRRKATRKLRQHIARQAMRLQAASEEGRIDPLGVCLFADYTAVKQDPWGGAICYKDKTLYDINGGTFAIYVD